MLGAGPEGCMSAVIRLFPLFSCCCFLTGLSVGSGLNPSICFKVNLVALNQTNVDVVPLPVGLPVS